MKTYANIFGNVISTFFKNVHEFSQKKLIISGDSGETDYEYEYNESGPSLDEADLAVNGGNLAVKSMDEANALLDALMGVRRDDDTIESNYVTEISDSTSVYSDIFDQSDQLFYQILRF